jgi:hypothetical protein
MLDSVTILEQLRDYKFFSVTCNATDEYRLCFGQSFSYMKKYYQQLRM